MEEIATERPAFFPSSITIRLTISAPIKTAIACGAQPLMTMQDLFYFSKNFFEFESKLFYSLNFRMRWDYLDIAQVAKFI